MDYGRNNQVAGNNNQPFFTAGAGNISPDANYFESENNLDLTNQDTWNQVQSQMQGYQDYHNYRGIGSRAIVPSETATSMYQSPEIYDNQEASSNTNTLNVPEVDPYMPPDAITADRHPLRQQEASSTYHRHLIHGENDHISKNTITEINQIVAKLYQTDNASDFYKAIRGDGESAGMLQDYLKNTFSREVA